MDLGIIFFIAARLFWFILVTCIHSYNEEKYINTCFHPRFYLVTYFLGEAVCLNLYIEMLDHIFPYSTVNVFGAIAIALSSWIIRFKIIEHIRYQNPYHFNTSKHAKNPAKCEALVATLNFARLKDSGSILLFKALEKENIAFAKAILKLNPALPNKSISYAFTDTWDFGKPQTNVLEAYINCSLKNGYYCIPEAVDCLISAGVIITEETRNTILENRFLTKDQSHLVTIKLIMNRTTYHRQIVSESEIPAEFRNLGKTA